MNSTSFAEQSWGAARAVGRTRLALGAALAAGLTVAPVGCRGGESPPRSVTLLASFPDDAVAVCFIREDDGSELGCTAQPIVAPEGGTVRYRGTTLELKAPSPTGRVAIVQGIAPEAPGGGEVRVRAVAYNDAGASDPSHRYFALDRSSSTIPRSREDRSGMASRQSPLPLGTERHRERAIR